MPDFVGAVRHRGGHFLALVALAGACGGNVDERGVEVSGGTGGTVSPAGGAVGMHSDGAGGGGYGGVSGSSTGGYFGDAGSGFGGSGFGNGGYYGDAGSTSFGGSHSGGASGTGGNPCNPPWMRTACATTQGCIDPRSPTPERVELNQRVIVDAGQPDVGEWDAGISDATARLSDANIPDGGLVDGAPVDSGRDGPATIRDGGLPASRADVCGGGMTTQRAYLAFDVWSDQGPPVVGIYSVNQQCSGNALGSPQFAYSPPPARTWTTQCVELAYKYVDRVVVEPGATTRVENLRFVSDCRCPRALLTSCGEGWDAGLLCRW